MFEPNPVARALLAETIYGAAEEKPYTISDTPEMAKTISGKAYRFVDNRSRDELYA